MMNDQQLMTIARAVLAGFLGAAVADLDAWVKSGESFDWRPALRRWIQGAVTGLLAGLGLTQV